MASHFPRENNFQNDAATYGMKLSADDKVLMFMKENNYSQSDIYDEFEARNILKNSSWVRNRWTRIRKELFALCLEHGETFTKGDALVIPSMMNEGIVLVTHPAQNHENTSKDAHEIVNQSFDEGANKDVNESANENAIEDVNEDAKLDETNDAIASRDDQEMADASDPQEEAEVDNGVEEENDSDGDKMSVDKEAAGDKPTVGDGGTAENEVDAGDDEVVAKKARSYIAPPIHNAPTYDARAEVIVCNLPRHFTLRHAQQVFRDIPLQHIQPSSTNGVFSLLCTDAKVADFLAKNWNARSVEGKLMYIIPAWKQAAIMPAIMHRRN